MNAPENAELIQLQKAIQQKIGRNLLAYQQFEHQLKYYLSNYVFSGSSREIQDNRAQQTKENLTSTMGQLLGKFEPSQGPGYEMKIDEQAETESSLYEPHLSFRFDPESSFYKEKKAIFSELLADRNEFVHHLLSKIDQASSRSWKNLDTELDQQYEKLNSEVHALGRHIDDLSKTTKRAEAFIRSDDFEQAFERLWLIESPVVVELIEIAKSFARADGWVLLSHAGEKLRKHMPEEMMHLKERYGHKTLKPLMLATGLFELREEVTDAGGIRMVFKELSLP